jgi:hypothetical protein
MLMSALDGRSEIRTEPVGQSPAWARWGKAPCCGVSAGDSGRERAGREGGQVRPPMYLFVFHCLSWNRIGRGVVSLGT